MVDDQFFRNFQRKQIHQVLKDKVFLALCRTGGDRIDVSKIRKYIDVIKPVEPLIIEELEYFFTSGVHRASDEPDPVDAVDMRYIIFEKLAEES